MRFLKILLTGSIIPLIYLVLVIAFEGRKIEVTAIFMFLVFWVVFFYLKNIKAESSTYSFLKLILPFIVFMTVGIILGQVYHNSVFVIFPPLIYYFALWFFKSKNYLFLCGCILLIFTASWLYIPTIHNIQSNQNSSKEVRFPYISLISENKSPKILSKDKIYVLDFWTNSCGHCYKKFPEFEQLSLKYKKNPHIEFYSVNVAEKRDSFHNTLRLVKKLNYTYETVFAPSMEEIEKKLGIYKYPELMIVKNDTIRFQGYLNTGKNILVYNTVNVLNNIIKD